MSALSALKDLFGPSGYRLYADALGRAPTTFHASISNAETVTSRIVEFTCHCLMIARDAGINPQSVLQDAGQTEFALMALDQNDRRTDLQMALMAIWGEDALDRLGKHLGMSAPAIRNAVARPGARYEPHFRLIAKTGLMLKRKGREVALPEKMSAGASELRRAA